jgi:putative membrane protein
MNLYEFVPQTVTFLADDGRRFGPMAFHPWFLVARLIFLVLVVTAVVLVIRYGRGLKGERTLRDVYARGEVDETGYRERLAVLRATRK